MPQQPEYTSSSLAVSPAPEPVQVPLFPPAPDTDSSSPPVAVEQPPRRPPQRIPRWLERAELFLRVLLRMYIGLAVCYAPWSRMFWDQNPLFVQYPTLSIYAANGAVRGLISGLGLLNLWFAFRSAIDHRDR